LLTESSLILQVKCSCDKHLSIFLPSRPIPSSQFDASLNLVSVMHIPAIFPPARIQTLSTLVQQLIPGSIQIAWLFLCAHNSSNLFHHHPQDHRSFIVIISFVENHTQIIIDSPVVIGNCHSDPLKVNTESRQSDPFCRPHKSSLDFCFSYSPSCSLSLSCYFPFISIFLNPSVIAKSAPFFDYFNSKLLFIFHSKEREKERERERKRERERHLNGFCTFFFQISTSLRLLLPLIRLRNQITKSTN
jgi:hypothetical protein